MNIPVDQKTPGTGNELSAFLTVPQLASLLHVNEKKIYQLAGCGEIPGTKVTGKWIFPRRLIEDWLLENSHGGVMHDRLLIGGSDDRFVHQICSSAAIDWQQQALVSYSPSGTRHGLRMLDTGRIDACFINWGASEPEARRHLALLKRYRNHSGWVVIRLLTRNQGLVISRDQSALTDLPVNEAIARVLQNPDNRWAMRQQDSGTERLLEDLCSLHGRRFSELTLSTSCNSERSAMAAINAQRADVGSAARCVAAEYALPYLPVADVSLDLVMSRKTYFRTLVQDFITRLTDASAVEAARSLGGYEIENNATLMTID